MFQFFGLVADGGRLARHLLFEAFLFLTMLPDAPAQPSPDAECQQEHGKDDKPPAQVDGWHHPEEYVQFVLR